MTEILACDKWRSNADLILDVHNLGYIKDEDLVLDATLGKGTFWKKYRPPFLITNDLGKGLPDIRFDFRYPPFPYGVFDVVVFDAPYKLNGTPTEEVDERYGVEVPTRWQDRMQLIKDGVVGLNHSLTPGGLMLLKCQDQVCSGKVRWQTIEFINHATKIGLDLEDMFLFMGGRKQPDGRKQVHARRNYSSLLVLRKS